MNNKATVLLRSATLALLLLSAHSQLAVAACHATDFDLAAFSQVMGPLNDATTNLKALAASPTTNQGASGLLGVATQITDRAAVEGALFLGYIVIYDGLSTDSDKASTDRLISGFAHSSWESITGYADFLTVVASGLPQYAEEIRAARDRVRKLAGLFSCADDGSRHR